MFFSDDSESSPGVFLLPEGVEEVEDDFPPGDLVVARSFWANFIPKTFLKPLEYMIGGEGDPQGSSKDQGSVVEFVNDHIEAGDSSDISSNFRQKCRPIGRLL